MAAKELIGGKLYDISSPQINHARILHNLRLVFADYDCHGRMIYIDEENQPVPDLIVAEKSLAIELISPETIMLDRHHKMKLYAQHGIEEYWIVDAHMLAIEMYRLCHINRAYALHDICVMLSKADGFIGLTTSAFSGPAIKMQDIFADVYENVLERR